VQSVCGRRGILPSRVYGIPACMVDENTDNTMDPCTFRVCSGQDVLIHVQ
jgi:hypothetical protein